MKANIFKNTNKLTKGFTLIELLVVVSIIGMLASVVLVSLQGARNKAKDAKLIAEMRELQKAMELYRLDNSANPYPADGWFHGLNATCPVSLANSGHNITEAGMFDAAFLSKYMSKFPTEIISCGISYMGIRANVADNTALTCNDGTNVINPDNLPANSDNAKYHYVFVVDLLNTYTPSPSLPKASANGVTTNAYCFLGPKI